MIQSFDYKLVLNSGEEIQVSEMGPGLVSELGDPEIVRRAAPWLVRCSRVTRTAVEEAKRGHSRLLDSQMGTPPVSALLKMEPAECGLMGTCSMADAKKCATTNVDTRRGRGKFPECWQPRDAGPATELVAYVVRAWRDGRRVLLVED